MSPAKREATRRKTARTARPAAGSRSGSRQVEEYLAKLPQPSRRALERLRATIRRAAPRAEEGIAYGIPAFRLGKRSLVAYAAFRDHCSFFPMSSEALDAFAEELEGFETSKGTIRFTADAPLAAALVARIVRARIAEHERGPAGGKRRRTS